MCVYSRLKEDFKNILLTKHIHMLSCLLTFNILQSCVGLVFEIIASYGANNIFSMNIFALCDYLLLRTTQLACS